uniref:Uncharacterized protein n=1 Tax=Compsopogon caeruleus TaxID=31354 RepID=A0A6T6BTP7_9RHOD|mmetsp:Transcript_14902/g.30311  ORF Transcript_14902/g.30311 Transcript_14902/m.30311 type:complete len:426 (+) Transcript_14902:143-1420(+)
MRLQKVNALDRMDHIVASAFENVGEGDADLTVRVLSGFLSRNASALPWSLYRRLLGMLLGARSPGQAAMVAEFLDRLAASRKSQPCEGDVTQHNVVNHQSGNDEGNKRLPGRGIATLGLVLRRVASAVGGTVGGGLMGGTSTTSGGVKGGVDGVEMFAREVIRSLVRAVANGKGIPRVSQVFKYYVRSQHGEMEDDCFHDDVDDPATSIPGDMMSEWSEDHRAGCARLFLRYASGVLATERGWRDFLSDSTDGATSSTISNLVKEVWASILTAARQYRWEGLEVLQTLLATIADQCERRDLQIINRIITFPEVETLSTISAVLSTTYSSTIHSFATKDLIRHLSYTLSPEDLNVEEIIKAFEQSVDHPRALLGICEIISEGNFPTGSIQKKRALRESIERAALETPELRSRLEAVWIALSSAQSS